MIFAFKSIYFSMILKLKKKKFNPYFSVLEIVKIWNYLVFAPKQRRPKAAAVGTVALGLEF